jgi:hypothetical protein
MGKALVKLSKVEKADGLAGLQYNALADNSVFFPCTA